MKILFLRWLCDTLVRLCNLTHPIITLEERLTGRGHNLATWSFKIDKKYELGRWQSEDPQEAELTK
jgi:hypothetical protein